MVIEALLVVITLYVVNAFTTLIGGESSGRPIVLCSIIGIVLGDPKTGIIMGGMLEAVYMGINAIGGVTAANASAGATISTCLVILGGMEIETAVALAMPVGTILNISRNITSACKTLVQPIIYNIVKSGNMKKFKPALLLAEFTVGRLLDPILNFFMIAFGIAGVEALMGTFPAFILTGLSAAGNMLTVVGLAVLAVNIWNVESAVFILVGFILSKILGLGSLAVAILVGAVGVMVFFREKEILELKNQRVAVVTEGDDFYD